MNNYKQNKINRGPEKEMEEKTTSFIYIDEKALKANAAHKDTYLYLSRTTVFFVLPLLFFTNLSKLR